MRVKHLQPGEARQLSQAVPAPAQPAQPAQATPTVVAATPKAAPPAWALPGGGAGGGLLSPDLRFLLSPAQQPQGDGPAGAPLLRVGRAGGWLLSIMLPATSAALGAQHCSAHIPLPSSPTRHR